MHFDEKELEGFLPASFSKYSSVLFDYLGDRSTVCRANFINKFSHERAPNAEPPSEYFATVIRNLVKRSIDEVIMEVSAENECACENENSKDTQPIYTPSNGSPTKSSSGESDDCDYRSEHEDSLQQPTEELNATNVTNSTQNQLPTANDTEIDYDESAAYLPLECFFCGQNLFGDHQLARHVFLQECQKNFNVLDPQLFQWVGCRLCPTVFPGASAVEIRCHLCNDHGSSVKLRTTEDNSGTIELLQVHPAVIEKVCADFRRGLLKRRTTEDHSLGSASWLQKKPNTRRRKNSDPDYCPDENRTNSCKKAKKGSLLRDFSTLSSGKQNICISNSVNSNFDNQEPRHSEHSLLENSAGGIDAQFKNDGNANTAPRAEVPEASIVGTELVETNSNSNESPKQSTSLAIESRDLKMRCTLCHNVLSRYSLSLHLTFVHRVKNPKQNFLICKVMFFETRRGYDGRKKLYVCLKEGCWQAFHRRDKHCRQLGRNEDASQHIPFIKKVLKVNELPEELLPLNVNSISLADLKENVYGINFGKIISAWTAEKVEDYDDGIGKRTFAPERMGALEKKLALLVSETDGFECPSAVDELFRLFAEKFTVRSAKSKVIYCRHFLDFIQFANIHDGRSVKLKDRLEWDRACTKMTLAVKRVLSRSQGSVSAEHSINHEFKSYTKLSKDTVTKIYEDIVNLLEELLKFFESELYSKEAEKVVNYKYKLLQCCLVFIVSNRNVSRVGSAIWLKKTFFSQCSYSSSQGIVLFKCVDTHRLEQCLRKRNVKNLRQHKMELTLEIMKSNKNFKNEAAKQLIMTYKEYTYMMRYLAIKENLKIGSQIYLFLKRNQTDENLNRNVIGKWHNVLETHLKLEVKINTRIWRQSMCTIFSEQVTDMVTQNSLDRHIGHSRKVAQLFYEIKCKMVDACVTSRAVDTVLESQGDGAENPKKTTLVERVLDENPMTMKDFDETPSIWQICAQTFKSECVPVDEIKMKNEVISDNEHDENEDEDEQDDEDGRLLEKSASEVTAVVPKAVSLAHVNTENDFIGGLPSKNFIFNFLIESARKKNLTVDQYRMVAEYFSDFISGSACKSFRELHTDIQAVQSNPRATYDHICHLLKKLNSWKENDYK